MYAQPLPRWEAAAPAGVARQELYPEVLDSKIYVAGGLLSPNTGYSAHFEAWDATQARWTRLPEQKVFAESWVYDPAKDQWDTLPPTPTAHHGQGAATLNSLSRLVDLLQDLPGRLRCQQIKPLRDVQQALTQMHA